MPEERIWVAGHRGMVGSAVARHLRQRGNVVLTVGRDELDLSDQHAVTRWLCGNKPNVVIFAAAKVGGILANDTRPAEFIYGNLALATNVINGAHCAGVERLIFLGSSCIYPKLAPQPLKEEYLLTGALEPTNEWYAVAKIAGIKLCQAYRKQYGRRYVSLLPCNLYGPGDNADPASGHVLPALLRRFHEAQRAGDPEVSVWGSGRPLREFLHVDDLARAVALCTDRYDEHAPLNCGSGDEVTIAGLADMIREVVGYRGRITFDRGKPDGAPRKLMDSSRLRALGWSPSIGLMDGLAATYHWFLANGFGRERRAA